MAIPRIRPTLPYSSILRFLRNLLFGCRSAEAGRQVVADFETAFADRYDLPRGVVVSKARVAFYLLLKHLDLPSGGEVMISAFHIADFVNMIRLAGFTPVAVDVDPRTNQIDFEDLERKTTDRTCLLLVTHLVGLPTDMDRIQAFAEERGVKIVEDCSQALTAEYRGRRLGTFGAAAIFSLSLIKPVSTLAGGMILSADTALLARVREEAGGFGPAPRLPLILEAVKNGVLRTAVQPFLFDWITFPLIRLTSSCGDWFGGYQKTNRTVVFRDTMPPEFLTAYTWPQAKMGLEQLESMEAREAAKRRHAEFLYEKVKSFTAFRVPELLEESVNGFWLFPVFTERVAELQAFLLKEGIDSSRMLLSAIADEPAFAALGFHCPAAARHRAETLFVPAYADLTRDELERVASALERFERELAQEAGMGRLNRIVSSVRRIVPFPLTRRSLSAGLTLAANVLEGRILNRRCRRGPLFVTWLVTFDCNAHCRACSTHDLKKQFPEAVSRERALEIAHEIGRAGSWAVGFTGGEVLLWPHLFDVIKVLKAYGVICYVVTNGLLLEKHAGQLVTSGVDYVVVSLDSDRPDEHDDLRCCPGLFAQAFRGIDRLKALRGEASRPMLKSTTVLSKVTLPRASEIVASLAERVDAVSVQPLVDMDANTPHALTDDAAARLVFQPEERGEVERMMDSFLEKNPSFNNAYFRTIPRFWFDPDSLIADTPCWSPFLRLQILPNGEVFHCTMNPRYGPVGNLNESSFLETWNNPQMQKQREEIRHCRNGCICGSQDASFNAVIASLPLVNRLPAFCTRSGVSNGKADELSSSSSGEIDTEQ